jgi:hypothetical protein
VSKQQDQSCPHCGISESDQHTLRQAGLCDGIKNGEISGDRALAVRAALSKGRMDLVPQDLRRG